MLMTEEKIRENFSKNLTAYRRHWGFTQLELAEKLNYSDKSVSKWERGESLPDVFVIYRIAELLKVSVSDMISEHKNHKPKTCRNKIIITLLSAGVSWLAAAVLYFIFQLVLPDYPAAHFLVYAMPASAITVLVFCCIWWNRLYQLLAVSAVIWSVSAAIYLVVDYYAHPERLALIFVISTILQGMTVLWFCMKR